ncbi:hypothetical protein BGZ65_012860 [Modicella reniformis]|uniref:Uncharacterized protein n=1 Tax=Modicella reniformis TaxID=1440133 RepID=A0A9P6INN5_9FUNG|nr:hypothetical protein BGZ65_012860 [Modicella reniformis]
MYHDSMYHDPHQDLPDAVALEVIILAEDDIATTEPEIYLREDDIVTEPGIDLTQDDIALSDHAIDLTQSDIETELEIDFPQDEIAFRDSVIDLTQDDIGTVESEVESARLERVRSQLNSIRRLDEEPLRLIERAVSSALWHINTQRRSSKRQKRLDMRPPS